jgi:hypothetical protein
MRRNGAAVIHRAAWKVRQRDKISYYPKTRFAHGEPDAIRDVGRRFGQGRLGPGKGRPKCGQQIGSRLTSAYDPMLQFRQTVHALPRMTREVNKAKRGTIDALDELLRSLDEGHRDAQEAGKLIDVLLNTGQKDA